MPAGILWDDGKVKDYVRVKVADESVRHLREIDVVDEVLDCWLPLSDSSEVHYVGLRSRKAIVGAIVSMIAERRVDGRRAAADKSADPSLCAVR